MGVRGAIMNICLDGKQLPLFDLPPAGQTGMPVPSQRGEPTASSGKGSAAAAVRNKRRGAGRKPAGTSSTGQGKAYLFRVVLKWNRKVWRTIQVRGDQTLEHLHLAIQEAFGWDNDHMYSFFMSGKRWDPDTEYADPRAEDGLKADRAKIASLKLAPQKRFLYLFDYGDELEHDVWLVSVAPAAAGVKYPRIVKVHGESPPQYPMEEDEV